MKTRTTVEPVSLVLYFARSQITPRHLPLHAVAGKGALEIVGYVRTVVVDGDEQHALDHCSPLPGECVLNSVDVTPS